MYNVDEVSESKGKNVMAANSKDDIVEIFAQKLVDVMIENEKKSLKKPTKSQLRRWSKMPDPFRDVTQKDRDEAWERGCVI